MQSVSYTHLDVYKRQAHISYGPVLDLSRDPLWSRVEETFGEDPVLSGRLGAAMVIGLGSGDLSREYATIATLDVYKRQDRDYSCNQVCGRRYPFFVCRHCFYY